MSTNERDGAARPSPDLSERVRQFVRDLATWDKDDEAGYDELMGLALKAAHDFGVLLQAGSRSDATGWQGETKAK